MTGGTNIAALRTALVVAESKASEAEAKASKAEAKATEAEARAAVAAAKVSDAEAEIAFLKLTIEKLRREFFGQRSERKQRLLDQLELGRVPQRGVLDMLHRDLADDYGHGCSLRIPWASAMRMAMPVPPPPLRQRLRFRPAFLRLREVG